MRLDGLISGMDTRDVISRIMEIERQPIKRKEESIESIKEDINHWKDINKTLKNLADNLSPLNDRELFLERKATSNNENISVSATSEAEETSYELDVIQKASIHRISSMRLDERDEPIAELLPESVEEFGGRFEISIGEESQKFPILENNNSEENNDINSIDESTTLEELRDIINESELEIRASILDNHLIIEGTKEGMEVEMKDIEGGNVLEALDIIEKDTNDPEEFIIKEERTLQEAREAVLEINGIEIQKSENVIEVADGVTIDISETRPEEDEPESATITVSHDTGAPLESINNFIDKYNSLREKIQELGGERGSPLQGDSTLRIIQNSMRRLLSDPVNSLNPRSMGLELDREGYLSLRTGPGEENTLEEKIKSNPQDVALLFAGENNDGGIASRFENFIDNQISSNGIIEARKTNLGNSKDRLNDRIERMERRLEKKEERQWSEFNRMETALQEMRAMQSRLWAISYQMMGMYN